MASRFSLLGEYLIAFESGDVLGDYQAFSKAAKKASMSSFLRMLRDAKSSKDLGQLSGGSRRTHGARFVLPKEEKEEEEPKDEAS